jgi:hypothetical protein
VAYFLCVQERQIPISVLPSPLFTDASRLRRRRRRLCVLAFLFRYLDVPCLRDTALKHERHEFTLFRAFDSRTSRTEQICSLTQGISSQQKDEAAIGTRAEHSFMNDSVQVLH